MMKYLNNILVLAALSCLFSFSQEKASVNEDSTILGKWLYLENALFTRSQKGSTDRWYDFKANGEIIYSTCTDRCGCMRVTHYGNWEWENDSIIAIQYEKYERWELEETQFEKSEKKLKITRIDPYTLKIVNFEKK